MSKYPTAAGMDPEDAARALMRRSVKRSDEIAAAALQDGVPKQESDNEAALKAWRRESERGLLRALRVEMPDGSSENLPEAHKGDGR